MQVSCVQKESINGWNMETFLGGRCRLDVLSESGVPFSYSLTHEDELYAPKAAVVPSSTCGEVHVLLTYCHVFTDLERAKRVENSTRELREFCAACNEKGILNVVANEKGLPDSPAAP